MIKPLGKILVECGFITNMQLSEALLRQKSSGGAMRMGDILLEMGMISREKLESALQKQQETALRSNLSRGATGRVPASSPGERTPFPGGRSTSPADRPFSSSAPSGFQPPASGRTDSREHLALVQLLIKKGIISMEEYFREIQGK